MASAMTSPTSPPDKILSPRKLPIPRSQVESPKPTLTADISEKSVYDVAATNPNRKVKSKKKSSAPGPTSLKFDGYTKEGINDLQEDVVDTKRSPNIIYPQNVTQIPMDQQPLGQLFVEHERRFRRANEISGTSESAVAISAIPKMTPLGLGLIVYKNTSIIVLFTSGILAGFSLWHCIMVYLLMANSTMENFVQNYSVLSYPSQGMFSFLTAISATFVLEKCDIGKFGNGATLHLVKFGTCLLALICYMVTLILNHSVVHIEDALSLNNINITQIQNDAVLVASVWTWRNVCLCRCLTTTLGWILFCKSIRVNRLEKRLQLLCQT